MIRRGFLRMGDLRGEPSLETKRTASAELYDQVRLGALAALLLLLALSQLYPFFHIVGGGLTYVLLERQDITVIPLFILFLLIRPRAYRVKEAGKIGAPFWLLPAGLLFAAVVCWAGRQWAFADLDLSRDEQMANFDAMIYARGAMVWPIPGEWRPFARALNLTYIQPVGNHEAWVSNYLPVDAMVRALFAQVGLIDAASPAFVLLGLVCLYKTVGRLWPDESAARMVAVSLYLGSSQVLVTGMTAYAMNVYLALNLLWLLLFLRGGRAGHCGAMVLGFLATGVHQPLFHPLFVLPFLDMLRRQGRWKALGAYCLAYLGSVTFWILWPLWVTAHGAVTVPPGATGDGVGYVDRVLKVITFRPLTIFLMAMNLVRFAAWQHLLLVPMMVLGVIVGWRRDPLVRALALGLLLPLLAATLLAPYQGHGWGYRYLHGVIGSACILGVAGYVWLRTHAVDMRLVMLWGTALSLGVLLPIHLLMIWNQVGPVARFDAVLAASRADILVLDTGSTPFARDRVINRPDLGNRPIRMIGAELLPQQMKVLCSKGALAFVDAPHFAEMSAFFGLDPVRFSTAHQRALRAAAGESHCLVVPMTPGA